MNGRSVQFGLNVDPNVGGLPIAERIAAIADANGLELVGVQDHPYNPRLYDTFTLITWLASKTKQVRFFPNVANLPLRPPVMLAKQAATMDAISGGHFELGLGSGGFRESAAGMGAPSRRPAKAREALSEAIDIVRAYWAGEPFTFHGKHYELPAVQPGPPPAHQIGIWLGVVGPRSAALVGAKADGWSVSAPYVPPDRLDELNAIITAAARDAGRDPGAIVRLYNVMGMIRPEDRDAFHGPVSRWVETLTMLHVEHGMNTFMYWPTRDRERQSQVFAQEVVPAVRAALNG